MRTREEYVDTLKKQLDRWNEDVSRWEAQARSAQADIKESYEEQLKILGERREEARYNLRLLRGASASAWSDLQSGTDEAWTKMREAVDRARAHFEKK